MSAEVASATLKDSNAPSSGDLVSETETSNGQSKPVDTPAVKKFFKGEGWVAGTVVSCMVVEKQSNKVDTSFETAESTETLYKVRYSNDFIEDYPLYALEELITLALVEVGAHVVLYSYETDKHFHAVVRDVNDKQTNNIRAEFETARADWIDLRRFKFQLLSREKKKFSLPLTEEEKNRQDQQLSSKGKMVDQSTQTPTAETFEKETQTRVKDSVDQQTQTPSNETHDQETQTPIREGSDQETQTPTKQYTEQEVQTLAKECRDQDTQTLSKECVSQETQTLPTECTNQETQTVFESREQETQTLPRECSNQETQTVRSENTNQETQTTAATTVDQEVQAVEDTLEQETQTLAEEREDHGTQTANVETVDQETQAVEAMVDQEMQTVVEEKSNQETQTIAISTVDQETQAVEAMMEQETQTVQEAMKEQETQTVQETSDQEAQAVEEVEKADSGTQTASATTEQETQAVEEVTNQETQTMAWESENQETQTVPTAGVDQGAQAAQEMVEQNTQTIPQHGVHKEAQTSDEQKPAVKEMSTQGMQTDPPPTVDQETQAVEEMTEQETQTAPATTVDQETQAVEETMEQQTQTISSNERTNQETQTTSTATADQETQAVEEMSEKQTQTTAETADEQAQPAKEQMHRDTQTPRIENADQQIQTMQTETADQEIQVDLPRSDEQQTHQNDSKVPAHPPTQPAHQSVQATEPDSASEQAATAPLDTNTASVASELKPKHQEAAKSDDGQPSYAAAPPPPLPEAAGDKAILDALDEGGSVFVGKAKKPVRFEDIEGTLLVLNAPELSQVRKQTELAILWDQTDEYYAVKIVNVRRMKTRTTYLIEYLHDGYKEWTVLSNREFYLLNDFVAYEDSLRAAEGNLLSNNIKRIKREEEDRILGDQQDYDSARDPFARIELADEKLRSSDLQAARGRTLKRVRVGCRVAVWWTSEKTFYKGKIGDERDKKGVKQHRILYDDGDKTWVNMETLFFFILVPPRDGDEPDRKRPADDSVGENDQSDDGEHQRALTADASQHVPLVAAAASLGADIPDVYKVAVGSRIEVSVEGGMRLGVVKQLLQRPEPFLIEFDDGTSEWMDLGKVEFRIVSDASASGDAPPNTPTNDSAKAATPAARRSSGKKRKTSKLDDPSEEGENDGEKRRRDSIGDKEPKRKRKSRS